MTCEVVPATEPLVSEVEAWLDEEEVAYKVAMDAYWHGDDDDDPPVRGFRCNWDSVKRTWREGYSRLYILLVDGQAIGFLDGKDILEIRPDLRRGGYGRILAQFMIANAWSDGWSVIEIEIAPREAEPFWKAMGFTPVSDRRGPGGGVFAYRVLPRTFDLSAGERVAYSIEFFTERGRYSDEDRPLSCFEGEGERLPDGSIQLPSRAYCFDPNEDGAWDYYVRIAVDGAVLHFDKAKRDSSRAYGIERDPRDRYFVDRIRPVPQNKGDGFE